MTSDYPAPAQLLTQYCFLSPIDHHERLAQDLNRAVILYSVQEALPLNRSQIVQTLLSRYGGSSHSWRVQRVRRGFLVFLPSWIYHDELNLDSHFWEQSSFFVQPWQTLDRSDRQPPGRRVLITITDFPIAYWHPYYIRQATVTMGSLVGIHRECITRDDRMEIKLWVDTPDVNLIPYQLIVRHQTQWTECQVYLEGRQSWSPDPRQPPPPSGAGGTGQYSSDGYEGQDSNLYVPPWRRRILRCQNPRGDASQRGAPAAELTGYCLRSTDWGYTPSPPRSRESPPSKRLPDTLSHPDEAQSVRSGLPAFTPIWRDHTTPRPQKDNHYFHHDSPIYPFHDLPNYPFPNSQMNHPHKKTYFRIPLSSRTYNKIPTCHHQQKSPIPNSHIPCTTQNKNHPLLKNLLHYPNISLRQKSILGPFQPNSAIKGQVKLSSLQTIIPLHYSSPFPHPPVYPAPLTSQLPLSHNPPLYPPQMAELSLEDEALIQ